MLSGCAVAAVGGAVVGGAVGVTKLAVKGTVGAGKLAYRGTKAAVNGTAKLVRSDEGDNLGQPYRGRGAPSANIADDYANLPDAND